jgi:hypothetical protein
MPEWPGLGGHGRAVNWPGREGAGFRARPGATLSFGFSSSPGSSVSQYALAVGVHSAIDAQCRAIAAFAVQPRE